MTGPCSKTCITCDWIKKEAKGKNGIMRFTDRKEWTLHLQFYRFAWWKFRRCLSARFWFQTSSSTRLALPCDVASNFQWVEVSFPSVSSSIRKRQLVCCIGWILRWWGVLFCPYAVHQADVIDRGRYFVVWYRGAPSRFYHKRICFFVLRLTYAVKYEAVTTTVLLLLQSRLPSYTQSH